MRGFDDQEKQIVSKIIDGDGYARNLINLIDSMSNLEGVRIQLDKKRKTGEFLFEIQSDDPSDQDSYKAISREPALLELLITHVTLLRYLEKEELAFFFARTKGSTDLITFGAGAVNRPFFTMAINDPTIVDLLIKYADKEIRPSPLLRQLNKNKYLTDDEVKFKKQFVATWSAIAITVLLGLHGIYSNYSSGVSQDKRYQQQIAHNEKLSDVIAQSIQSSKVTPIDYKIYLQELSNSVVKLSESLIAVSENTELRNTSSQCTEDSGS